MSVPVDATASVRGWIWQSDGVVSAVSGWPDVRAAWDAPTSRLWIDLERPTLRDVEVLGRIFDLDAQPLEECLDPPERPRVDAYDDYLALFLSDVLGSDVLGLDERGLSSPRTVVAFCGERFLVTVHAGPMQSIETLHRRSAKHGATMFESGVDVLLYRLVDLLVDNYLVLLDRLEDEVDRVEGDSFDVKAGGTVLREVARLRAELLDVRRLASAQHALLAPLARGEFDYVSGNLESEFRHVEEHLAHTLDLIEVLRERLTATVQNYHSTLALRTNHIMRVLTVFAAVVLPVSLIAGIYGMNLPVWPSGGDPDSFWVVLVFMGLVAGGLIWFFRTREWF